MHYKLNLTLSISLLLSACSVNSTKDLKLDNPKFKKAEMFYSRAQEMKKFNCDSIKLGILLLDSAIVLWDDEKYYSAKIEFNNFLGFRSEAWQVSREYWSKFNKGYGMGVATGLLYDVENKKDSADIFYKKAIKRLREIRKEKDIYYQLDVKYLELLLNGDVDCKEFYSKIKNREDSSYLRFLIELIDTLSVDNIKRDFVDTSLYTN
ncbi:MAG: hypothetical protein R3Y50_07395 [Rikenellaceae bacterium]